MGKVKKITTQHESSGQTKISSFFVKKSLYTAIKPGPELPNTKRVSKELLPNKIFEDSPNTTLHVSKSVIPPSTQTTGRTTHSKLGLSWSTKGHNSSSNRKIHSKLENETVINLSDDDDDCIIPPTPESPKQNYKIPFSEPRQLLPKKKVTLDVTHNGVKADVIDEIQKLVPENNVMTSTIFEDLEKSSNFSTGTKSLTLVSKSNTESSMVLENPKFVNILSDVVPEKDIEVNDCTKECQLSLPFLLSKKCKTGPLNSSISLNESGLINHENSESSVELTKQETKAVAVERLSPKAKVLTRLDSVPIGKVFCHKEDDEKSTLQAHSLRSFSPKCKKLKSNNCHSGLGDENDLNLQNILNEIIKESPPSKVMGTVTSIRKRPLPSTLFSITSNKTEKSLKKSCQDSNRVTLPPKPQAQLLEVKNDSKLNIESKELKSCILDGSALQLQDEDFEWLNSELSDFSISSFAESSLELKQPLTKDVFGPNHSRYRVSSVDITSGEICLTLNPIEAIEKNGTQDPRRCILRGFWAETDIQENDIVNVLAPFINGQAVVTDAEGLLVLNPDLLLTSTAIVSTLFCARKAVMAEKFKGLDPGNKSMLIGCLVHELFQEVILKDSCSIKEMKGMMDRFLADLNNLHEMLGKGLDPVEISSTVESYFPHILEWVQMYKSKTSQLAGDRYTEVQIMEVCDIEDSVWCPTLGVKGKIDVTANVKIRRGNKTSTKILPLEIKTGKSSFSIEHQGQVTLYSMMMARRDTDPGAGLLLYLQNGPKMKLIEANHASSRGLIQMRNDLAKYLRRNTSARIFPEPISRVDTCRNCPFLLPCSLMETTIESNCMEMRSDKRQGLVVEATQHLKECHVKYFEHWYILLDIENATCTGKDDSKVFWFDSSTKREKNGSCFSQMKIKYAKHDEVSTKWVHTFVPSQENKNLKVLGLQLQESVVISSEINKLDLSIAMGSIINITEGETIIVLDKNLTNRPNSEKETFRIDRHTSFSFTAVNYKNLCTLMANQKLASKLRELIIEKREPEFCKHLKKEVALKGRSIIKSLNRSQQRAIFRALMAEDYVLLQGMPGTGKTSTIVALVRLLVLLGRSVLLTSFTHSAVDNILLKLKDHNVPFMRLGRETRIHPDIKPFSASVFTAKAKTVADLSSIYKSMPVIATTCLSVNNAGLQERTFDVCIVDEASQVLQPTCLGPLFLANTFVLVGDSKQLPPLAQSSEAKEKGICESLFLHLESPKTVMELTIQYRMNSEIMRLSNELTYEEKLECGCPEVANATLPNIQFDNPNYTEWLSKALSSELQDSVVFIDTQQFGPEQQISTGVVNEKEADILATIVSSLYQHYNLANESVGIISFYRSQVNLLREKLSLSQPGIEVNTVDQYQGRDKSVILMSCVRSNSQKEPVGDILKDEHRLNVALTRAKHKLIIVGQVESLRKYKPFQRVLSILRKNQIVAFS